MASEKAIREANFHRSVMERLAMSQDNEIRQLAAAILDCMLWHDSHFIDLQNILSRISHLESQMEDAGNKIR